MNADLSLIDELFAIIAGITLSLAFSGWQKEHSIIVVAIVVSVGITAVLAVVSINQTKIKSRWISYLLTILSAVAGSFIIGEASAHDILNKQISPLIYGVVVWIACRECARLIISKQNHIEAMPNKLLQRIKKSYAFFVR